MTQKQITTGRLKLKMTQGDIAKKFGVSVRFWRDREIGAKPTVAWMRYAVLGLMVERYFQHIFQRLLNRLN